jgi:hypothetical protein
VPIDAPAIYGPLQRLPPGVVLEIPLGIRDGFGSRGNLDEHVLFYQTVHEHPQMGGFVARLSKRVAADYESDPIVRPILDLSERPSRVERPQELGPCRESLACSVRYVIVNETDAPGELKDFVARSFSLRLVDQDATRALYVVGGMPGCSCDASLPR